MSEAKPVVVYGAGGHGKVVLDALELSGRDVAGFVDDDPQRAGATHCGYPVAARLGDLGSEEKVVVVVAIGDAVSRGRVTAELERLGYGLATVVHPSAVLAPDVSVGPGAMVLAAAVINPGVRVGRGAIINTGTVVDHDCAIGDFAHVAPGACLAGGVSVGSGALVGIGAVVLPGVKIGADAVVGASAVVVGDVGDGVTVAGVPAKPVG
ncbi:MAG: acetyltransferase [Gemmatimonadota bacterium]|nr:MAG: acetyltransferase [Gemmatimonadota bacterium]